MGIFRQYIVFYLEQHSNVDQNHYVVVRQLESTPFGLPLEVYCFTNTAEWLEFERIQSDIFEHLIAKAKDFNLEFVKNLTVQQ